MDGTLEKKVIKDFFRIVAEGIVSDINGTSVISRPTEIFLYGLPKNRLIDLRNMIYDL